MLYEIKKRIRDIINNDISYLNVPDTTPQNIDAVLPCVLLFAGAFPNPLVSGTEVLAQVPIDVYTYLYPIGTNNPKAEFEIDEVTEELLTVFLTRPRLQYNDRGLSYVNGDISVSLARDVARPITYPAQYPNGVQYWGIHIRLTVPYRTQYRMNVGG